jgi:hypothetical protein
MRIADQFLHIVASAVKDTHWEAQLREVMSTLKLPFDYLSTDEKKGKDSWKLPGYSGLQATTILEHVKEIAHCFPNANTRSHIGTKEYLINKVIIPNRLHEKPRRKK